MDLAEELEGSTLVMRLRGELDMATVTPFRQTVGDRLAAGDVTTVVIDLAGLTFTDSAGLTALVEAQEQADREGVALELTGVSRQMRKLIEVTSLSSMFTIR